MANLEHTRWVSISNMHEIVWRAELEMVALHWPLMKKPKQGLARDLGHLSKKLLLSVALSKMCSSNTLLSLRSPKRSGPLPKSGVANNSA